MTVIRDDMSGRLLAMTAEGLYCPEGKFYIDPWELVDYAVITHAHSDHARPGSRVYLATHATAALLRVRFGSDSVIQCVDYGETVHRNGVMISLHPAGHVLGSAQARIESGGEVWVVSGDYKLQSDPTCAPFEPLRCHHFVTEATFGLPVYRWRSPDSVIADVHKWWADNAARGVTSVLYAHPIGKAQRLLAMFDMSRGPVLVHGGAMRFLGAYRNAGVALPHVISANADQSRCHRGHALVIAPPKAASEGWLGRFGEVSEAAASGWMLTESVGESCDDAPGFALSDHADWNGLLDAVYATGASNVWVMHGTDRALLEQLASKGIDARAIADRPPNQRCSVSRCRRSMRWISRMARGWSSQECPAGANISDSAPARCELQ